MIKKTFKKRLINLFTSFIILLNLLSIPSTSYSEQNQILKKIETYFNNMESLEAKFTQLDHSGNITFGRVLISKPGKIRFEYNSPSMLLIVGDGKYVTYYDEKIGQITQIAMKRLPIQFLLNKDFSFKKNNFFIENMELKGNVISLTLNNPESDFAGKVTLLFEQNPIILRKWIIEDSHGFITRVSLQNINIDVEIDHSLFKFDDKLLDNKDRQFLPD